MEDTTFQEDKKELERIEEEAPYLVDFVRSKFEQASTARLGQENIWLSSYRDYRGIWDEAKRLRSTEKSRVFVKIPKTKTLAAQGQINEILFGANKFPLSIINTERPDGVAEFAHFKPDGGGQQETPLPDFGYVGDGTRQNEEPRSFLGGLAAKFSKGIDKFLPGKATSPNEVEVSPAKEAAREMEKTIKDQITETHATKELRKTTLDQVIYGTGIIKGPFTYEETVPTWEMNGEEKRYIPKLRLVPRIENVPIWNFYPDPAATDASELEYVIQRHKLSKSQLRNLQKLPLFNKQAIDNCIMAGANYVKQSWESSLGVSTTEDYTESTRWEVLEYWGVIDKEAAEIAGIEHEKLTELDEVQANIWVCNNEVLRAVLNPFEPAKINYHVVPYEVDSTSIWGVGVPENMNDSTMIMNGHARMAIDNLALAGNLIFDIDESSLVAGQSMEMYPGKIFRRQSGNPGQAVFGIKFPNTTNENMLMFDKFRQLSDEETGIPSYSHGATGVTSTTRTASGMSMLMGAAALNAKTVVKNIDDYLLVPLGEALYFWNMQFNDDPRIRGDFKVKAMGTDALMQKEVRSQRLLQFLQIISNPILAPWVKPGAIIKELAYTMDLDPDEVINDMDEAKIYASLIAQVGQLNAEVPIDNGTTGTGNGNIVPANTQFPGEQGFSGTPGGPPQQMRQPMVGNENIG